MRCHHSSKAQMSLRSFTHFNAKRHAVAAFMVVSRRVRGRLMARENCSGASDRAPERKCPTGLPSIRGKRLNNRDSERSTAEACSGCVRDCSRAAPGIGGG